MIIKLEAKGQKPRERETGGVSIRARKVKDREVRWKSEAKLRNRCCTENYKSSTFLVYTTDRHCNHKHTKTRVAILYSSFMHDSITYFVAENSCNTNTCAAGGRRHFYITWSNGSLGLGWAVAALEAKFILLILVNNLLYWWHITICSWLPSECVGDQVTDFFKSGALCPRKTQTWPFLLPWVHILLLAFLWGGGTCAVCFPVGLRTWSVCFVTALSDWEERM